MVPPSLRLSLMIRSCLLSLLVSTVAWGAPPTEAKKPVGKQTDDTEQPKSAGDQAKPAGEPAKPAGDAAKPASGPAEPAPSPEPAAAETQPAARQEPPPRELTYGAGARVRWVSVPGWLLNLFTAENVPLSSYAIGFELFRRKGEMDLVLGFAYQDMSPPDGNWLGKNKMPGIDTDFVQFKGLGFIGVDASFMWHTEFNQYGGFHFGGGIGLGIVTGEMLRTSSQGCTDATIEDLSRCRPVVCRGPSGCTEAELKATEGRPDGGPADPHRFRDDNVPPVVPIVNMVIGLHGRLPQVKGMEVRLDLGFYDAFIIGTALAYVF